MKNRVKNFQGFLNFKTSAGSGTHLKQIGLLMSLLWRLANRLCVNSSLSKACKGLTWSVCRSLFMTWKQFQKPHGMYPNHYFGQPEHLMHLSEWLQTIPAKVYKFFGICQQENKAKQENPQNQNYALLHVCSRTNNDIDSRRLSSSSSIYCTKLQGMHTCLQGWPLIILPY